MTKHPFGCMCGGCAKIRQLMARSSAMTVALCKAQEAGDEAGAEQASKGIDLLSGQIAAAEQALGLE